MTPPMPAAWSTVAREYARSIMPEFRSAARTLGEFAGIRPGDRVLDVACGPGTAAIEARALGAGAITGVDYAAGMLEVARELTRAQPDFSFIEGDVLELPVPDAAFDVAISNFGAIFAPDPLRAVAELARAVRPGGHAALTAWMQNDVTAGYYELAYRYVEPYPGPHDSFAWGNSTQAATWLGSAFTSIETRPLAVPMEAASPAAIWEVLSHATGRVAAGYVRLAAPVRQEFDATMQRYFEQFRCEDGRVHWPRQALLIRGRRPVPRAGSPGEIFI